MRKLTTEQKAQRYDEVFEKAKSWYVDAQIDFKKSLETLFPELKESGDEKVRKALIDTFKFYGPSMDSPYLLGIDKKDVLSWLEKQANHVNFYNKIQIGDIVTRNEDGVLVNLSQLKRVAKKDEKQGKNNMGISEATKQKLEDNLHKALEKETPESCNEFLEKQGEQKPADKIEPKDYNSIDPHFGKPIDKVEPKFHEGEWLCENEPNNYARFIQILETVNVQGKEKYRISRDIHNDEDIVKFDFVEKYYHKFDIKDAKDGDVLYLQKDGKEHIIIYKGVIKERFRTFVSAYCAYNGIVDAFCFADVSRYIDIAYEGIMPATKEQRDLLEKVMADAGYTFDFEKKELKKIERKPDWSEEDENRFRNLIYLVEHSDEGKATKEGFVKFINRLKSLNPQNTWKPSDLPHWKKSALPNDNTTGFNSDYFCHKGYCINYKELFEKLPKDD